MNSFKTKFEHIKEAGAELVWYCGCLIEAMIIENFGE